MNNQKNYKEVKTKTVFFHHRLFNAVKSVFWFLFSVFLCVWFFLFWVEILVKNKTPPVRGSTSWYIGCALMKMNNTLTPKEKIIEMKKKATIDCRLRKETT